MGNKNVIKVQVYTLLSTTSTLSVPAGILQASISPKGNFSLSQLQYWQAFQITLSTKLLHQPVSSSDAGQLISPCTFLTIGLTAGKQGYTVPATEITHHKHCMNVHSWSAHFEIGALVNTSCQIETIKTCFLLCGHQQNMSDWFIECNLKWIHIL